MERVHVVGATEVPQWSPGAKPWQGVWGRSPPEAEAKCEINVHFLTFSCIKFWI